MLSHILLIAKFVMSVLLSLVIICECTISFCNGHYSASGVCCGRCKQIMN